MTGVATFSKQARLTLAKNGDAEKDGSYPIRNEADLRNAIQAYGRSKDPAATKAHIIQRAKSLGATHLLPASWM